jgi:murein DD-endopeptidase MepM/ murein hydrolase activator NlpD
MGDTGYGKEGTRGQFPVHLHFGIYYNQGEEEKSVNPYRVLQREL